MVYIHFCHTSLLTNSNNTNRNSIRQDFRLELTGGSNIFKIAQCKTLYHRQPFAGSTLSHFLTPTRRHLLTTRPVVG